MKPLTTTQVTRCEQGKHTRCRCRCGGTLHGTKRSLMRDFFEELSDDDPHKLPKKSRQLPLPPPCWSQRMTYVTIDRESATTEDLYEVIATLITRLERAEEIICALVGFHLTSSGRIGGPSSEMTKAMEDELMDYVLLIDQARRRNATDAAFLNARE